MTRKCCEVPRCCQGGLESAEAVVDGLAPGQPAWQAAFLVHPLTAANGALEEARQSLLHRTPRRWLKTERPAAVLAPPRVPWSAAQATGGRHL